MLTVIKIQELILRTRKKKIPKKSLFRDRTIADRTHNKRRFLRNAEQFIFYIPAKNKQFPD
jgi:hypothetical protein